MRIILVKHHDLKMCGLNLTTMSIFTHLKLQVATDGGPSVVVSTAAFPDRVRGSVPGLVGLKETKMFLPHPRESQYCGELP